MSGLFRCFRIKWFFKLVVFPPDPPDFTSVEQILQIQPVGFFIKKCHTRLIFFNVGVTRKKNNRTFLSFYKISANKEIRN